MANNSRELYVWYNFEIIPCNRTKLSSKRAERGGRDTSHVASVDTIDVPEIGVHNIAYLCAESERPCLH